MKELVIISGKGGTGKTSITASFAALAKDAVIADCDVDAADLHLVIDNDIIKSESFEGDKEAVLNNDQCIQCNKCEQFCRFNAVINTGWEYMIDPFLCEGCGLCAHVCPSDAIQMKTKVSGNIYIAETGHGPFVYAALNTAEENSGKLVSKVREEAKKIAIQNKSSLILVDGAPGTGCPVIASLTGAHYVLIVAEPTLSGFHDMKRIIELVDYFKISAMVCINKADLNDDITGNIENFVRGKEIPVVAKIPYDTDITLAQLAGKSIVEFSDGKTSQVIQKLWHSIEKKLIK